MRDGGLESWEEELLPALVRVAIGPTGDFSYRFMVLRTVADGALRKGDPEGVEAAVREGLRLLREGGGLSDFHPGPEAYQLGFRAASAGLFSLARETYETGIASFEEDVLDPGRGVLWLATADAWQKEGDEERALHAYREAAAAHRLSSFPRRRLEGLTALIEAEARAGADKDLELLIDEGIGFLEEMEGRAPEPEIELVAYRLGRAAGAVDSPAQARRIYELTLGLFDEDARIAPAVLWQDIGDTWIAEDDGTAAVRAYRKGVADLRRLSPVGHFLLLADIAPAELAWGTRAACEAAVVEAADLLGELSPSPSPELLDEAVIALAELSRELDRTDMAAHFEAGRVEKADGGASGGISGGEPD